MRRKRLFLILASVLMMIGLMSVPAFAADVDIGGPKVDIDVPDVDIPDATTSDALDTSGDITSDETASISSADANASVADAPSNDADTETPTDGGIITEEPPAEELTTQEVWLRYWQTLEFNVDVFEAVTVSGDDSVASVVFDQEKGTVKITGQNQGQKSVQIGNTIYDIKTYMLYQLRHWLAHPDPDGTPYPYGPAAIPDQLASVDNLRVYRPGEKFQLATISIPGYSWFSLDYNENDDSNVGYDEYGGYWFVNIYYMPIE